MPSSPRIKVLFPGFALACMVAMAAQFVANQTQSPVMLIALLFGICLNSAVNDAKNTLQEGLSFSATTILKIGIVLLGARISFNLFIELGWPVVSLVILGLIVTLLFGIVLGKLLGQSRQFAILTAGAVSICGASAALAISSILPDENGNKEQNLFFTILGVTIFSTVAMIVYPAILSFLAFDNETTGIILGATIHDVAQVVGAGFSVSEETGEIATLTKLIRISLLAPFVIILSLIFNSNSAAKNHEKPPLIPKFILGFLIFVILNSMGFIPIQIQTALVTCSKVLLLVAISAVGLKVSLKEFGSLGRNAILLLLIETIVIFFFATVYVFFSAAT